MTLKPPSTGTDVSRHSDPTTLVGVAVGRARPRTAALQSGSAVTIVVGSWAAAMTASAHATVVVPWPPRAPNRVTLWRAGGGASPTPPPLANTDRRWRSGRIGHDLGCAGRSPDEVVVRGRQVCGKPQHQPPGEWRQHRAHAEMVGRRDRGELEAD